MSVTVFEVLSALFLLSCRRLQYSYCRKWHKLSKKACFLVKYLHI